MLASTALLLLLLQGLSSFCSAVNVLHIGGLFSIFNKQGDVDLAQLEHASAFLQAVEEINKNSAILPNHQLQVLMGDGADSLEVALSANQMFQTGSFVGAVSALDNSKGGYATKLFENANSMIVNSMTTDTSFGDGSFYPLKAQTVPVYSYQGKVHQSLLCSVNVTRVAIFSTDDLDGVRYANEFSDGSFCKIKVLGHFTFPSYTIDFSDVLREAVSSDARSFMVAVASPVTLRNLLQQGHESGLFRDGTQITTTEIHGFDEVLVSLTNEEVKVITKGLISTEYFPDYGIYTSSIGRKFYNSWVNRTSLGNCSTQVDAAGNKYLHYRTVGGRESCASLNFSSYRSGASSMDPYAVLSYDAAYTLAWGLHYAIEKGLPLTGATLSRTIIDDVNFVGASGRINLYEGDALTLQDKGNREVGYYYKLSEFRYGRYIAGSGNSFLPQLLFNPERTWALCPPTMYCPPYEHLFNEGWRGTYPPYAFATAPAIVKIGGLFSAFVEGGSTLDKENAEFLSMFLMAVSEINNKTDGIHDDLLPITQLKFSVVNSAATALSAAGAYSDITNSFFHSGVSGIVNTYPSSFVKSINAYAVEDQTFQVISMAQDSDLADGLQYSFKASTTPLDTFIGSAFQDILCSRGLEKIAVLHEDNSFGTRAARERHFALERWS